MRYMFECLKEFPQALRLCGIFSACLLIYIVCVTVFGLGFAFLVAQTVTYLPAMQETWVWSLNQEDPLEKEMATRSSILAWTIPWTEDPDGLQFMGLQRVRHDWETNTFNKPTVVENFPLLLKVIIAIKSVNTSLKMSCLNMLV